MIDLVKLHDQKQALGFYAQQLAYPDKQTFAHNPTEGDFAPPVYGAVMNYWQEMQQLSFEEIEEKYVETFDFQKDSTLYMTYFKFEDSRERGQMLAKIKATYEMLGLEIEGGELSDYLPLMCEFLCAAEWLDNEERVADSFSLLLAVLEDGTYHLLKALEKQESPYVHLVSALRETFKSCLQQEVSVHG